MEVASTRLKTLGTDHRPLELPGTHSIDYLFFCQSFNHFAPEEQPPFEDVGEGQS
jgi:hypothetical protein